MLRGINVSGQKKIAMADLRIMFESLGFNDVGTYIQSGNVIFDAKIKSKQQIKSMIENAIKEKYKYAVHIELRTNSELDSIIKASPYDDIDMAKEGNKVLVTFMSSKPSIDGVLSVQKYVIEPERLLIKNTEIYVYCPNGHGKSKLSNTFLENKLKTQATTRNWRTVHKLYELSAK